MVKLHRYANEYGSSSSAAYYKASARVNAFILYTVYRIKHTIINKLVRQTDSLYFSTMVRSFYEILMSNKIRSACSKSSWILTPENLTVTRTCWFSSRDAPKTINMLLTVDLLEKSTIGLGKQTRKIRYFPLPHQFPRSICGKTNTLGTSLKFDVVLEPSLPFTFFCSVCRWGSLWNLSTAIPPWPAVHRQGRCC